MLQRFKSSDDADAVIPTAERRKMWAEAGNCVMVLHSTSFSDINKHRIFADVPLCEL